MGRKSTPPPLVSIASAARRASRPFSDFSLNEPQRTRNRTGSRPPPANDSEPVIRPNLLQSFFRGLPLPCVGEQVGQRVRLGETQVHAYRGEALAPPHLRAGFGIGLDGGEDARLVEHHVHMPLVPERGEDLAGHAERRPAVMVLLDRVGKREREPPGLLGGGHRALSTSLGDTAYVTPSWP